MEEDGGRSESALELGEEKAISGGFDLGEVLITVIEAVHQQREIL
jgi:hypothetical protein